MTSIDRIFSSSQTGTKPMEKGMQDPVIPLPSFSLILGELQQLLLPSFSSNEMELVSEQGKMKELPNWSEEQWQEISAMLSTLLQGLKQVSSPIQTGEESRRLLNLIGVKQEKGTLLSVSEVLSILHTMKQNGVHIPRDVSKEYTRIMKILEPTIFQKEIDGPHVVGQKPDFNMGNWSLERGRAVVYPQPMEQTQYVPIEGVKVESGSELNIGSPAADTASLLPSSNLLRTHFQPVKPEFTPIHRENFVPEMTELLVSKIRISPLTDGTEARISLYPEHLGHVDVKISLQQGQMVAQFVAETAMGKDMLESNLAALRVSLQQQGIQAGKIEVQTAAEAGLLNQNQHQQPQDRSGSFQQNHKSKRSSIVSGSERQGKENISSIYDHMLSSGTTTEHYSKKNIDFTA